MCISKAFKKFIARGKFVDFALALIISIALTIILLSFVWLVVAPCIEYPIGTKIWDLKLVLKGYVAPTETKAGEQEIAISYGQFIGFAINIAFILFSLFIGIQTVNRAYECSEN